MKIHFCDLCNESVPQSDLEQGRAFLRKGRVICEKCDGLMSAADPMSETITSDSDTKIGLASAAGRTSVPPDSASAQTQGATESGASVRNRGPVQYPTESGGAMVAGFLSAVAVVLVAVVAVMLNDRIEATSETLDDDVAAVQRDVAAAEEGLVERIAALNTASLRAAQNVDTRFDEFIAAQARAQMAATKRLDQLQQSVEDLAGRLTSLAPTERAVADHGRSLIAVEASLDAIRSEMSQLAADLEARPVIVAQPVLNESVGPAWLGLVEDLKSSNSGVRWNTVDDLGRTADPAVVPYLIPLLLDDDTFVRMAVARFLGDLGEAASVGPLIESLEDSAESVRDAAVVSLRKLTRENFRFDPQAKRDERTKRVRAWRDWWEKQNKA